MRNLEKLQLAIYKTIENIALWQDVLQMLCEVTGAKKGIITLRDRTTAELVVPTDVENDLSSPLLYGFSLEEIGGYIEHYIEFDPWTAFEKLHHPDKPIALTKYVKYEALVSSPFWEWLAPQGISDTVVLDIGTSYPNWIAMNLYYDGQDPAVKRKIVRYTTKLQQVMQQAWELGQKVRAAHLEPSRLGYFLDQQLDPSILFSPAGEIILLNHQAEQLCNPGESIFSCESKRLLIEDKKLNKQFLKLLDDIGQVSQAQRLDKYEFKNGDFKLTLTLIEKAEDPIGVDKAARLLTIRKLNQALLCVWETPGLTNRERQLVEVLAGGGRIVDFSNQYGVTKSTSHFHWGNVKKKLNIVDRAQIVTLQQAYLKERSL